MLYFTYMEVLAVDGKNYVKSSVIARELGYTSDYVGQLCRSGKVNAKLFGRTWYVEKNSISGHKVARYRSSKALTKRVLTTHDRDSKTSSVPVHRENHFLKTQSPQTSHFYNHSLKNDRVSGRYSSDDSVLLPLLEKATSKNIQIKLADSEKISVLSPNDSYNFEVPSLPQLRFKGVLTVKNIEDEKSDQKVSDVHTDSVVDEHDVLKNTVTIHPKEVDEFSGKKTINKVISSKKLSTKKDFHLHVSELHLPSVVQVHTNQPVQRFGFFLYFVHSFLAIVIAFLFTIVLFPIDANVLIENGQQTTTYTYDVQNLYNVDYKKITAFKLTF